MLMKKLVTRLRADSLFLPYRDLEMPLIPVMVCFDITCPFRETTLNIPSQAKMEHLGVGFIASECKRHKDLMEAKLRALEKQAHALAGREFSLTSAMETGTRTQGDEGEFFPQGAPHQCWFGTT